MSFKCLNCQKSIKDEQIKEKIRCPFCGYRVLLKQRPKTRIKVKAK